MQKGVESPIQTISQPLTKKALIKEINGILKQYQTQPSANQALKTIEKQFGAVEGVNNLIADCTRTKTKVQLDRTHKINDFQLSNRQVDAMHPDCYYVQYVKPDLLQGLDERIFKVIHPTIQMIDFQTLRNLLNHYLNTQAF